MINPQKIISLVFAYKFLIIALIAILIIGGGLFEARKYLIDKTKVAKVDNSSGYVLGDSSALNIPDVSSDQDSPTEIPKPSEDNVLGSSTNSTNNNYAGGDTLLTVTPFPTMIPNPTAIPTLVPLPTIVPNLSIPTPTSNPTPTSAPPSPHSCTGLNASPGQPVFYYSETNSSQTVNSSATITIDLRDCNNNSAPVSDTLTITQSSGPNTAINGDNTPPVSIETTNGQASFTVSSQTSGTAVYIVTDTTHSFNITDPHNTNPTVTFTISVPISTPTPTPANTQTPTPTPLFATPTSTITVSPTISPSPSVTITTSPTPT